MGLSVIIKARLVGNVSSFYLACISKLSMQMEENVILGRISLIFALNGQVQFKYIHTLLKINKTFCRSQPLNYYKNKPVVDKK